MTATLNPFGLSLFDSIGGKFRGQSNIYPLVVTNVSLGISDPVSPAAAGGVIGSGVGPGLVTNGSANATAQTAGVFQNVTYINSQGQTVVANYWPANQAVYAGTVPYVNVNDDPYAEFTIQCNAQLSANGQSFVHKNYDFVPPATNVPNQASGISTVSLNVSSYNVSALRSLRITGLAPSSTVSNQWSDAFPIVKVIINNHAYRAPQAGL